VGLFTPFIGNRRNFPVVRFGRVAMLSDEKIPWTERGIEQSLDLYLIECQSFGGNSGAPVFFYLDPSRTPGTLVLGRPYHLLLAGIMKGTFLDANEIRVIERSPVPFSVENVGIAGIVLAYLLHEVLFSDALTEQRAQVAE
jgi:hypothetical protein